jgi:hypothetical protein
LRTAAVLLTAARFVGRTENQQLLARLAQLVALTDADPRLRENQDRAAQATAARSAVEQLRLTGAQRASVPPGAPAATATRSRQPDLSYDLGRPGPGPVQGPPEHPSRTPPVDAAGAALRTVPAKVAATETRPGCHPVPGAVERHGQRPVSEGRSATCAGAWTERARAGAAATTSG